VDPLELDAASGEHSDGITINFIALEIGIAASFNALPIHTARRMVVSAGEGKWCRLHFMPARPSGL